MDIPQAFRDVSVLTDKTRLAWSVAYITHVVTVSHHHAIESAPMRTPGATGSPESTAATSLTCPPLLHPCGLGSEVPPPPARTSATASPLAGRCPLVHRRTSKRTLKRPP